MSTSPPSRRIKTSPIWLGTEFKEHEHPRASDGKFGDKPGSGTKKEANPFAGTKSAKRYKPKPEGWGEPIIPGYQPRGVWNIGTSGGYTRAKPLIDMVKHLYTNRDNITKEDVKALAEEILNTTGRDALYTLAMATGVKTGTSKAIAERVTQGLSPEKLELNEVDQTKELVLQRKVKKAGGTAKDARQVTEYARQLRDDANKVIDYRNDAVRYAYELLTKANGKAFNNSHPAFDSGDYTQVKEYDEVLTAIDTHYPGVLGADDSHEENHADTLWEMLGDGIEPRKNINDTFTQAFDDWEASKKSGTPF